MKNYSVVNPILLIVFRRLDTTKKVFDEIKKVKPTRLYISSDGPRNNNTLEEEQVNQVRNFLIEAIDWECKVETLFNEKNFGCQKAVSNAITWFFKNEEQGIILEDDILPSIDFFRYCDELLEKYKNNERIMHIAGMTYVEGDENKSSYNFCRTGGIWGWASWRRAWNLYELEMETFPKAMEENILDDLFFGEESIKEFYINMFKKAYKNTHTWDYQWTYTKIINNSINIMPSKNLVKNIGFGEGATHTTKANKKYQEMTISNLKFPLLHPKFIVINKKFDHNNFNFHFSKLTVEELKSLMIKITQIEEKLKSNNLDLYIYGAGQYGNLILKYSNFIKERVLGFIDRDNNKVGTSIYEKRIYKLDEIVNNKNVIIILTVVKDNISIENELSLYFQDSTILNINKM